MSTNYYGFLDSEDPKVEEGMHLCQSAVGWEMLLQASDTVTDKDSWLAQLDTFATIRDEYGREIQRNELIEMIEARLENRKRGMDVRTPHWLMGKEFRSGGWAFASYRFS